MLLHVIYRLTCIEVMCADSHSKGEKTSGSAAANSRKGDEGSMKNHAALTFVYLRDITCTIGRLSWIPIGK